MTTIAIHLPGDAPNLDALVDTLYEDGLVLSAYNRGDSYRAWGERRRNDEPTHIVLEVDAEHAAYVYHEIANLDILVDATLADDWSARVYWGMEDTVPGWSDRYPNA